MALHKNVRRFCICLAIVGLASSAFAVTDRRIEGVITAVDAKTVTIQGQHAVTARIDSKTRIMVDGHVAKISDLKITQSARGEMSLDEAWADIEATR